MKRFWVGTVFCGVAALLQLRAEGQVTIGQGILRNELPVDVIALSYTPTSRQFSTIHVPAHGQATAPGGGAVLLAIEPVAIEVGRRATFRSCTVARPDRDGLNAIVAELKAVDFLATASAKERIEAASALARLQIEQNADEQNTYLDDPLRNELRRQQERYASVAEKHLARTQDDVQYIASDVTARALAWRSVQEDRLQILHDQLRTFAPLVEQAKMAVQIRERELDAYERSAAAWQAYSATVVRALDERSATRADVPIRVTRVAKSCAGPSDAWDWLDVEGPDRPDVSTLVAEVSFDRGPKQLTVLRRLAQTDGWTGRLDWPSDGTSASIRLRWPGSNRWHRADGRINAERRSTRASVADARRAADEIEDKFKETRFRTAGGDVIRTAPVF